MAVRLERKLFTLFKYFVLLVPIFFILGIYLTSYFNFKSQYELTKQTEYLTWYEESEGYSAFEDLPSAPELKTIAKTQMNQLSDNLPKFRYTLSGRTYENNLFVCIYTLIMNGGTIGDTLYCSLTYLSYYVMVELVFLCVKLFRYFIFFFEQMFERKEDIVK